MAIRARVWAGRRRRPKTSLERAGRRGVKEMWKILIVAVAALFGAPRAAGGDKTNLVIILADDMGYADMACNGGKDVVTPNLDRLASEGMRLTSFYVTQGQCSPSR